MTDDIYDPADDRCGMHLHLFADGPTWQCVNPAGRGHTDDHVAMIATGGWYYLPPGCRLGDPGVMAGIAWAHVTFGAEETPPALPELVAGPHEARCVIDVAEGGQYRGYAGDWARQLVMFAFKSDPENRAILAAAFPSWVAAVWLYERDPTQLRTLATMQEGADG